MHCPELGEGRPLPQNQQRGRDVLSREGVDDGRDAAAAQAEDEPEDERRCVSRADCHRDPSCAEQGVLEGRAGGRGGADGEPMEQLEADEAHPARGRVQQRPPTRPRARVGADVARGHPCSGQGGAREDSTDSAATTCSL